MSVESVKNEVIGKIFPKVEDTTKKTLGEAARKVVQSNIPSNYLILDADVGEYLFDVYGELANKQISEKKFLFLLEAALQASGWKKANVKSSGLRNFINKKLGNPRIYELPASSFRTFRDSLNAVLNKINGTEEVNFLKNTQLDHAGQGNFSSSAAASSLVLARTLEGVSATDQAKFSSAVNQSALESLKALKQNNRDLYNNIVEAYGNIHSLRALIRKVTVNWNTVVTTDMRAQASLELILTPDDASQGAKGTYESKLLYDILLPAIQKQMLSYQNKKGFENLEGSPTFLTRVGAGLISKVKPRVKVKNGKFVLRVDPKYNNPTFGINSTKAAKSYSSGEKSQSVKTGGPRGSKPRVRVKRGKPVLPDIRSFIGILNERLPTKVAQNMGSPRLNYRTGRFANSTRVNDIQLTSKGFPSIQYTYMRYPYEVFEYPGSGSPLAQQGQRDPRTLIDKSIREIMAEFAVGRFYTRRV